MQYFINTSIASTVKGAWHRDECMDITVSILQWSVHPKQQKMSNFQLDLSLKLSQGEVHDFSAEVQNDLRGGAHLPTPPLKIRPWIALICFVILLLKI